MDYHTQNTSQNLWVMNNSKSKPEKVSKCSKSNRNNMLGWCEVCDQSMPEKWFSGGQLRHGCYEDRRDN